MVLAECECRGCGAPLGRGPWAETVDPNGPAPKLTSRNLRDDEIDEAFWVKYPDLVGATRSKKVYETCPDCREI